MNLSPGLLVASDPQSNPLSRGDAGVSPARAGIGWAAAVALAVTAWAGTAAMQPAHAGGLVWSIGVQTPGAVVHVANAPQPMVMVQQPVYASAPPVVVYAPAPVYQPNYQPYYQPQYQQHPSSYQPYYKHAPTAQHGRHGHHNQWREGSGGWRGERGHYGVSQYGGQQPGFGLHR